LPRELPAHRPSARGGSPPGGGLKRHVQE
jgi:hypothetical protein